MQNIMELRIENAPEFGEGILKLTINSLLVSAFCPGSECHNHVLAVTKSTRRNLDIDVRKVFAEPGELNMWLENERGRKCVPIKLPNDVFSLHINNLPINIFRKGSPVHQAMQVLFPNANY